MMRKTMTAIALTSMAGPALLALASPAAAQASEPPQYSVSETPAGEGLTHPLRPENFGARGSEP